MDGKLPSQEPLAGWGELHLGDVGESSQFSSWLEKGKLFS